MLVLIVLLVSRLFGSASAITTSANKRMNVDAQARPLLNRLAIDFAQMIKRSDVDYFLKSPSAPQPGNDQIAFYSAVPGYNAIAPSPISLVAYRINAAHQTERMAKGLIWNGDSSVDSPLVFLPLTILGTWPTATSSNADPDYELTAPNVFRLEYCYVLKNGNLSDTPWDTAAGHTTPSGMQDVVAISVAIAAIDSKSRVLLSDTQLSTLAGSMNDFAGTMARGDMVSQWQAALDAQASMPRSAVTGVRIYEQYFAISR